MMKSSLGRWRRLICMALLGIVGAIGISASAAPPKPVACLAGTAAAITKDRCVPCPAGYYTDFDGAECTASGCCLKCPDGHICPRAGTSRPEMCQRNTAARFDRTACIICSNGFYSEEASQCISPSNTIESCCLKNQ